MLVVCLAVPSVYFSSPLPLPRPPPFVPHLRLRKDPLDPIDSGTKVQVLFKRLTDPEFAKREEEAKKKQVGCACVYVCQRGAITQYLVHAQK